MCNLRFVAFIVSSYLLQWAFCTDECMPPLEGQCGLTPEQVIAAQTSMNCSVSAAANMCSSDDCIEKQQSLINCLTFLEVQVRQRENRDGLEVHKLMLHLASIMDAKERAISIWFDILNRLNGQLGRYYDLWVTAEETAKERFAARRLVRERVACLNDIRRKLCKAKAALCAQLRLDALQRINQAEHFGVSVACDNCTDCPPKTCQSQLDGPEKDTRTDV